MKGKALTEPSGRSETVRSALAVPLEKRAITKNTKRADSGFTLIELSIVLVVLGVLTAIAIPNYIQLVNRTKETKVKENCHCVQVAVEAFAVGTNGIYPDANDAAIVANILPEFPGGQRLVNPFTNVRTEPVAGAATTPGQTGYEVNAPFGVNIGYTVTGFGKTQIVDTKTGGE